MSRGARRRSGRSGKRQGQKPPGATSQAPRGNGQTKTAPGESPGRSRRRRRGALAKAGLSEIIHTMTGRRGRVETLPPDGIVLEEVVADLEQEYGTPATPQEYRLIIKVASPDEVAAANEEIARRPEQEAARPQAARRRRRGSRRQSRRKAGATPGTETPT